MRAIEAARKFPLSHTGLGSGPCQDSDSPAVSGRPELFRQAALSPKVYVPKRTMYSRENFVLQKRHVLVPMLIGAAVLSGCGGGLIALAALPGLCLVLRDYPRRPNRN